MKRSHVTALAALATLGATAATSSTAQAAPANAPFGCNARAGQTCYFMLYLGPRATRLVQLRRGMKVDIPGIEIGSDRYCVDLNGPPPPTCTRKTVNATYND
jgi:hypothetical protein